jgi:CRP-like cAMP-binding protein
MSVDPIVLADQPLFATLAPEELRRVATWLELRAAPAGERLTGEGASGYSFFLVHAGELSVTRDSRELRRLGPGDFFGELAILGDGRRTATVTAVVPSTLLVLFGTEFRRLEAELPHVAAQLRQGMEERQRAEA